MDFPGLSTVTPSVRPAVLPPELPEPHSTEQKALGAGRDSAGEECIPWHLNRGAGVGIASEHVGVQAGWLCVCHLPQGGEASEALGAHVGPALGPASPGLAGELLL